jgi:DNA-binding transcriptional MerR regulator
MAHLTKEFGVSSRTIRFYEEKGLISPKRTKGNQRRYTTKERFRLKWILRGRRFGYSLHEISKILSMTETSAGEAQQIITTLEYGEKKLQDIENHIEELQIMRKEMLRLKEKLLHRLAELDSAHP